MLQLVRIKAAYLASNLIVGTVGINVPEQRVEHVEELWGPRCRVELVEAQEDQLGDACFRPYGHCFYRDAITKKGYSGVAIYSKREPDEVRTALGWAPFDDEGRYIEARYGNLSVVSFYIPSGSSGELAMSWYQYCIERIRRCQPASRQS